MFKNTKSITWILQPVCKIPKDFGSYFKKYKKFIFGKIYYSLLIKV